MFIYINILSYKLAYDLTTKKSVMRNMNVNEHERLSNITQSK